MPRQKQERPVFFLQTQILDYFNIIKRKNMSLLACVQALEVEERRRSERLHPCLLTFNPPTPHSKELACRLCIYYPILHEDYANLQKKEFPSYSNICCGRISNYPISAKHSMLYNQPLIYVAENKPSRPLNEYVPRASVWTFTGMT